MKHIVYRRADGGMTVCNPAMKAKRKDESGRDFLDRVIAGSVPADATDVAVLDTSELPDLKFQDAWVPDAQNKVRVSLSRARKLHMNRIREFRNRALEALDKDQLRALGKRDSAETDRIEGEKQALRDVPQTFDLETATSLEELKQRWPANVPKT